MAIASSNDFQRRSTPTVCPWCSKTHASPEQLAPRIRSRIRSLVVRLKAAIKASPLSALALKARRLSRWRLRLRVQKLKWKRQLGRLPAPAPLIQALVDLGAMQSLHGNTQEAVESFCEALELGPQWGEAYFLRAQAIRRQGRYELALRDYHTALRLLPNRADIYMARGDALLESGRRDDAIQSYKVGVLLAPERVDYFTQLGIALFLAGRYDEATGAWRTAISTQRELAVKHGADVFGVRILGSSWLLAVGHIAHIDIYLKMKLLGLSDQDRTALIVGPETNVLNSCLLDYWRRYVNIVPEESAAGIPASIAHHVTDEFWAATFPDGKTRWYAPAAAEIERLWEEEGRAPLLEITEEHAEKGRDCLRRLGVPDGAWYVCLHVREPGYWKKWNDKNPATRDADILSYRQAIETITAQGGWVIRMGDPSMRPLPAMEHVIDYAHSPLKSEWMDVFLCGTARFFVGTNSGFALVPSVFGVPCALTNWAPIGIPQWYKRDLWIPKLYWSKREERYLTFAELFSTPAGFQQFQTYFDSEGIKVVDNSPEEIDELVQEMLERTAGRPADDDPDDVRLTKEFNRLALANKSYIGGRVGRAFLRRHRGLLPGVQLAPEKTPTSTVREESDWS